MTHIDKLLKQLETGLPIESCLKLCNISEAKYLELIQNPKNQARIAKVEETVKAKLWGELMRLAFEAKNSSEQIKALSWTLSKRWPELYGDKTTIKHEGISPFDEFLNLAKEPNGADT